MKFKVIITFLILAMIIPMDQSEARKKSSRKYKSSKAKSYTVPRRAIYLTPYVSCIYAKELYNGFVEDQLGFGGGLNVRSEINSILGYFFDASYNNLKVVKDPLVSEKGTDSVIILTGGLYYTHKEDFGNLRLDIGYGAITAGNNTMTIFVPGIEYSKEFYNRISYAIKAGYPITNDWIVDMDLEEKYTSFSLSGGVSIIF